MEQEILNPSNVFTHYRCAGCGEVFSDRYGGTLILTGLHNIRMIGNKNQCISVAVLANEKSEKREDRRSPRFHSSNCLEKWSRKMTGLASKKLFNPQPEDLR